MIFGKINIRQILVMLSAVALIWVGYKLWSFGEWNTFLDYLHTNRHHLPALLSVQFLLMSLNLALETRKWQILVRPVQSIRLKEAFIQVVKGIQLGMMTPARTGDSIGKAIFYPSGEKTKVIVLSLMGSIIQNLVILLATVWALVWTARYDDGPGSLFINAASRSTTLSTILLVLIIGLTFWLIIRKTGFFRKFLDLAKDRLFILKQTRWNTLAHIFLLTAVRYSVFSLQFLILLNFFGLTDIRGGLYAIFIFYGALSFLPSAGAGDLSIRATLAIIILGSTNIAEPGIVMSSLALWFFNLAIPSLIPVFGIFSKRSGFFSPFHSKTNILKTIFYICLLSG